MHRKTSPKYRYHKARDCAVVTIGGRDHYLGAYDSDESHQKYHRLVAEHLAAPHQPATPPTADAPLTLTELMAAYWRFAKEFYVKGGRAHERGARHQAGPQVRPPDVHRPSRLRVQPE